MSQTKKPVSMCVVTIQYLDFLLPTNIGLRVVELMANAIPCEKKWTLKENQFIPGTQSEVSLQVIKPEQIKFTEDQIAKNCKPKTRLLT